MLLQYRLTVIIAVFQLSSAAGQNTKVLKDSFHFEKTIFQNGCRFKFWRGKHADTNYKILIERIGSSGDTILMNDFVRDGIYKVKDVNHDGYKDFILYYHDYDEIYFFDKKANNFHFTPVYMPMFNGIIDPVKKIYWGYRNVQYAEHYDYSILYTYINNKPFIFRKIVYKTKQESGEKADASEIELYRFEDGDYDKPVFVKKIKTAKPPRFDYKKYWRDNYKSLIKHH